MYLALSKKYGWTPQQISEMTPYQQLVYLTQGKNERYVKVKSFEDALQLIESLKHE